jgi:hypothetical protein
VIIYITNTGLPLQEVIIREDIVLQDEKNRIERDTLNTVILPDERLIGLGLDLMRGHIVNDIVLLIRDIVVIKLVTLNIGG